MNNKLGNFMMVVFGIMAAWPGYGQAQANTEIFVPAIVWTDSGDKGVIVAAPTKLIVIDSKGERLGTFNTNGPIRNVCLSPDGQKIVYTMDTEVWMIKIASKETHRVVVGNGGFLHWSPDSSSLMFSIETFKDENGQKLWQSQTIYVTDGDGKNLKQVYP